MPHKPQLVLDTSKINRFLMMNVVFTFLLICSKTIETRTKKAKKPAIPSFTYEFVNASNVHDGRITIHWKPNCCCQHGSQFYVKYQKDNETWQEEKPTYDNYYDLDLGHEAEKYEVMIVEVDDYFQTESDSQRITRNKGNHIFNFCCKI